VPEFLKMIDHLKLKIGQPMSIHVDDIRAKCHDEREVTINTIDVRTLSPAREAIVRAGLPYQVRRSRYDVIVQKIRPKPRRRGPT
jgi:hypothetical protein